MKVNSGVHEDLKRLYPELVQEGDYPISLAARIALYEADREKKAKGGET